MAAAVEADSEHTIAQGIVKSAEERQLNVPQADEFEAIPGHGVRAVVEGREFYMGWPAMLRRLTVTPHAAVREAADRAASRGQASVYLLTSTSALAAFAVAREAHDEAREIQLPRQPRRFLVHVEILRREHDAVRERQIMQQREDIR